MVIRVMVIEVNIVVICIESVVVEIVIGLIMRIEKGLFKFLVRNRRKYSCSRLNSNNVVFLFLVKSLFLGKVK